MTSGTLYAIIGDPVGQARSPEIFNARFAERRIVARMVALEVSPQDFSTLLEGLLGVRNFGGALITVPHKIAAASLAREKSPRVCIAGAANVLRRTPYGWRADLLDGEGFVRGLATQGFGAANRRAAIVGAGGAGLAIAAALLDAGASYVALDDRDPQKAESGVAHLARNYPGRLTKRAPGLEDDLVVNATPAGMKPDDPLPIDLAQLRPDAIVAEVIMKPPITRLLGEASRRGHPVVEGRHMLDGQVDAIWEFLAMSG
jgi:shikimate dehydrogenase